LPQMSQTRATMFLQYSSNCRGSFTPARSRHATTGPPRRATQP
jgi:hypothetical protein